MVALSLWKEVFYRYFCYSNGWQPCHYGPWSVFKIFVTPMDDILVIMEGSLLSRFFLLQWMVALSLWKLVCCRDFCYCNGWQLCLYVRQSFVNIFVTAMEGSLVFMEGSVLLIFLLLLWMVDLLLWKEVYCRDFCHSFGWQPCHYGRQCVVEIFVSTIDSSLVVMEDSMLSISFYSNGWQPSHYGRQSVGKIFVIPMDGSLVIMKGSLLSIFLLL